MAVPEGLLCTETHEWVRVEGEEAVIGITDHAAEEMQDIVFVELPEVGQSFEQGDVLGEIESVKAVSELYAPISGEVVATNEELLDNLDQITDSPYGDGWFVRVAVADAGELDGLMKPGEYATFLASGGSH